MVCQIQLTFAFPDLSELRMEIKVACNHMNKTSELVAKIFFSLNSPQTLLAGMNKFLSQLEITFRRDPNNYRPRINKLNSIKVRVQEPSLFNM